ncbi:MAG TPA: AI-2E family transporter [Polyangia bacterium]|nr:AI-2E family transporter [Polyangia bacterium]
MDQPSREFRPSQVTLKTVFTVSFGILLVLGLVQAVLHAVVSITLIIASIMIAVALDHAVGVLERRRVNRSLAIAIVCVTLLGLVIGLGFTLIPPVIDQGRELVHDVPSFLKAARQSSLFHTLDNRFHLATRVQDAERKLPELLEGAASPLLTALGSLVSAAGAVITIIVLVVFMLIFGGRLVHAILAEARPHHRPIYTDLVQKIYTSIGGYLGGLTLICCVNGTLTTTFLAIDRVPFFLPLGILSGFSSTVPYAGPLVAGTLISLVALLTKGFWHGMAAVIYFVAYGQLEGNILGPLVFRRTVHVNPLLTTLSILLLGEIAGVFGAIIAVPVVAALQIITREALRIRREQLHLRPPPAGLEDESPPQT